MVTASSAAHESGIESGPSIMQHDPLMLIVVWNGLGLLPGMVLMKWTMPAISTAIVRSDLNMISVTWSPP
jgi:hypothetical protein